MTMPRRSAKRRRNVTQTLWRYSVLDDRIHSESDSYALRTEKGTLLLDPLPLPEKEIKKLKPVAAIILSAQCHQRAAWKYRKQLGAKVFAPKGTKGFEEKPDAYYSPGARWPGGLEAVDASGPAYAHNAFLIRQNGGILICGDLIANDAKTGLSFIWDEYQDAPQQTRQSAKRLLRRKFRTLCFDHGPPLTTQAKAKVRRLLKEDAKLKQKKI